MDKTSTPTFSLCSKHSNNKNVKDKFVIFVHILRTNSLLSVKTAHSPINNIIGRIYHSTGQYYLLMFYRQVVVLCTSCRILNQKKRSKNEVHSDAVNRLFPRDD